MLRQVIRGAKLSRGTMMRTMAFSQVNPMLAQSNKMLTMQPIRGFYYPDGNHHHIQQEPHVLAKRIIRCVGDRLRHADPARWEGVPITFKTNWNNENNSVCIKTCVLIHDALEREFNIDIDDRKHLLQSVESCFRFIMSVHAAV